MSFRAKDFAAEFSLKILGNPNKEIMGPASLSNDIPNAMRWVKKAESLKKIRSGSVVVNAEHVPASIPEGLTLLVTDKSARLVFAKIIRQYFNSDIEEDFGNEIAIHRQNSKIRIGENVFIGKYVTIGDGTLIHHNVVIHSRTRIGSNCVIKSHVSLGTEGLGLELDNETDLYVKFPQLGGVVLEDNVEIGPTSTVRRSALDDTIIGRGTIIGALVNIGHNCVIGENCILTCQIVTSGSSVIGNNVFMGVNSIVKNGVNIGSHVTLGQGAVVTRSFGDKVILVGNPAEPIEDFKKWQEIRKKLIQEGI